MQLLPTGTAAAIAVVFPLVAQGQEVRVAAAPLTTSEATYDSVQEQVKADLAHERGYTGRGAVVAILDTGFQGDHQELSSQFSTTTMYDASIGAYVAITDGEGHGTHIAGVVAGTVGSGYSYGLAPDARILPIKVFSSGTWIASSTAVADGLSVAAANTDVSVVNLSLGADSSLGSTFEGALRDAVQADKLVVTAAGNDGDGNPVWPARYAKESWASGQIIAVGSVGADNVITDYSNRAGDTANWFLVAPGNDVLSAVNDGGYGYMSGTSASAPVVAGAAALLEGAWPQLSAPEVAAILFQTATDLGETGVDQVYGWGLLNVDQAMRPIGSLGIRLANARVLPGTTAALNSSTASWSGLRAAAVAGQFKGVAVDAFNRDFATDFGRGIRPPQSTSLTDTLAAAGRPLLVMARDGHDGSRYLAVVTEASAPHPFGSDDDRGRGLVASSALFKLADGQELAIASGGLAGSYFGLAETDPAFGNPYLGLARSATQVAMGYRVGRLQFKGGVLDSSLNAASVTPLQEPLRGGRAAVAEADYALSDAATIGVQFARLTEGESYLGATAGAAMALKAARTSTVTMHGAYELGRGLTLAAQYSIGRTADTGGEGLLTAARGVRSEAFALGLVAADRLARGDRLALTVSSPLRITSGTTEVTMPVDITADGEPVFDRRRIPLAAGDREIRLGLDYAVPLSEASSLSLAGALRNNANHVEGEREALVGLVYRRAF